jgi:DNA-binding NtrC family response regulator
MQINLTNDIKDYIKRKFGIVGSSGPMEDSIKMLLQAAPTNLSVLITGNTGTGKEVFANAIHGLSKRKNQKFVSVNCGAIPETLLESELFGHEKGAYTSADSQRKGYFETADNGTIFLDEIGEMPYGTQVKLLRVLESGHFSRLGSSDVKQVDVRVIAATNRDLELEVEKGNFRQDLYFRLKNVHIILPDLSDHKEDIPELLEYYSKQNAEKLKITFDSIDEDTAEILIHQPWQGNIREFKNLIDTIITLEKSAEITPNILRKYLRRELPPHQPNVQQENQIVRVQDSFSQQGNELGLIFRTLLELKTEVADIKRSQAIIHDDILAIKEELQRKQIEYTIIDDEEPQDIGAASELKISQMEKLMIVNALEKFQGNRRKTADQLGISERTLYRKIQEYDIKT